MGFKELLKSVADSLSFKKKDLKKSSKEKSMKNILEKLEKRKKKILKALKDNPHKHHKEELEEELDIVKFHIKKTEKMLS